MTATAPTPVVFRVHGDGDVFALFPTEAASTVTPRHCECYAHVGQHHAADPWLCVRQSRPATAAEAAPLRAELERIGYQLRPLRRIPATLHDQRRAAWRQRVGLDKTA